VERDKAQLAKKPDEAASLTAGEAPPIAGWNLLGARVDLPSGAHQDNYYYGRALDDKRALVVEVTYAGRTPMAKTTLGELARVLASAHPVN
jgi:hypothetical protein